MFIHDDFLLQGPTARMLYHEHAATMPIIDYHCHLSPKMIADDHRFRSITELWLDEDHYKWRAMRANGVPERLITGDGSDWEKFEAWAATMPYALRNPLYHWTHLELKTCFGITEVLNPESARRIYDRCNELLAQPEYSARGLMRRYGVEVVCTTDDPIDSLEYHQQIADSRFESKVLPAWRPDRAMEVTDPCVWHQYVDTLAQLAGIATDTYDGWLQALECRQEFFANHGCTVADHGLGAFFYAPCKPSRVRDIYNKVYNGAYLEGVEVQQLQTAMLLDLARMNARRGWVQQFHFGPLRNVRTTLFMELGANIGVDTIGSPSQAEPMARFLDCLDQEGLLTKTILYNINPADTEMVAAMVANFQDGSMPGKIQYGSGWWFLDQKEGMERQMNALSLQGLLSRFVGMLTDSRSFVSYPRHEYFRRILCNLIGADVDGGLIPQEELPRVCQMIEDISYNNAKRYFGF
ncbi:MAG: glucuronate isomerase [Bacteroidaceae bacterium]|nr:glucuronate isomerase [Bacteroidaceae bacterium]